MHDSIHQIRVTACLHVAVHAAVSRSRSIRIVSALSIDDRSRRRNALARAAKSSGLPNNDARRISRCSASVDCPLAAALRLNALTTSRQTLRTFDRAMRKRLQLIAIVDIMGSRCQFGNVCSHKSARHNALGGGFFDSLAEVGGDLKYFRGRADSFARALA